MPTVTVPRADVTVEEVTAVLRSNLGARYQVMPSVTSRLHVESSGDANSILVKRHWFEQASVRIEPGSGRTEIHVGSAANFTPTGLLFNRASIVRKVRQILEQAPELIGS
jgi:hypothetical protein